jgi:hypothetical protein
MMMRYSDRAPFRSYKKTDAQAYQDGVESARSWKAHWNHRPGGPYECNYNPGRDLADPDWIAYCEATHRHNFLYRLGWEVEMTKINPKFIAMLGAPSTDVSNALAANPLLQMVA